MSGWEDDSSVLSQLALSKKDKATWHAQILVALLSFSSVESSAHTKMWSLQSPYNCLAHTFLPVEKYLLLTHKFEGVVFLASFKSLLKLLKYA